MLKTQLEIQISRLDRVQKFDVSVKNPGTAFDLAGINTLRSKIILLGKVFILLVSRYLSTNMLIVFS